MTTDPIIVICLQEPGLTTEKLLWSWRINGLCHNQFKCTPINNKIMKKATGWEYLSVEISHKKNGAKKVYNF